MGYMQPIPVEQRFWTKVDRRGPDECWEWLAHRSPLGYGRVGVEGRRVALAHRVAYRLAHPGEPMPAVVRHTCDNPPCVNPSHLLGGTQADNVRDRVERGREPDRRGVAHPRARLDEKTVRRIAELRAAGHTYSDVAAMTGATYMQVADIVTGRAWTHLDLPIVARRYRPRKKAQS